VRYAILRAGTGLHYSSALFLHCANLSLGALAMGGDQRCACSSRPVVVPELWNGVPMTRPVVLPSECASCRHNSSACRLRATQGPCCPSCRCDVPILVDDREQLAAAYVQAQKELQAALCLLLRCEPFLPQHLACLTADVRAALGIDDRGFRVPA
jgi:hypothetical protein